VDLLGSPFLVYTDHKTLLNFHMQKDLSQRQARWMEELSIYDCKFVYIKGIDNSVADALSHYPCTYIPDAAIIENSVYHPYNTDKLQEHLILTHPSPDLSPLATIAALCAPIDNTSRPSLKTSVSINKEIIKKCIIGYKSDKWYENLISASRGMPELTVKNGLWFIGERLVIPDNCGLCEMILQFTHDALSHFGFFKSYKSIRHSFFWPGMCKDLKEGYIPSCRECMRNKSFTMKPCGPLHPLPVPDERCMSISMDFIGPLPVDQGYDCILTIMDRLGSDIQIIPTYSMVSAEDLAVVFFNNWYCKNGLPDEIVSDRDKLFVSKFWKHLMVLSGMHHKLLTSFHPETNGASEWTNKTVNQCICFHVKCNQSGWVRALPLVHFQMINTINKSTGYTPFQLCFGRSPCILPPLINPPSCPSEEYITAQEFIDKLAKDVADAKDNLLLSKISQCHFANKKREEDIPHAIGDMVMLSTLNRCRAYKHAGKKHVTKFMPRFNGPYLIVDTNPRASTVILDIPQTLICSQHSTCPISNPSGLTTTPNFLQGVSVRATAERLIRDLAGDPKHIYKHKIQQESAPSRGSQKKRIKPC